MLKFLKKNAFAIATTLVMVCCVFRIENDDLALALIFGYAALLGFLEGCEAKVVISVLNTASPDDHGRSEK